MFPDNAKKVFHGVMFDVYNREQKLYDGSTTTFEKLYRTPTTDVITIVDNKILIINQSQPNKENYFGLPGGEIEPGEDIVIAAKRELKEESGYSSDNIILIDEFLGNSKLYYHTYLFRAKDCIQNQDINLDGGEQIHSMIFVDFDEFLQYARNPKFFVPIGLKFKMYEALIDSKKYEELKKKIYG